MLDLNDKVNNGGTTAAGQLDADEWNQLPSEVQSAIESAGITLSGGDLTQLVKSVAHYSSVGQFFTGGGIADAYTAAIIAPRIAPPSLINGMELNLIIPATNTGATTLNAFGTGAVDVKLEGGSLNPVAGDMESGKLARFKYFTAPSAHWEILNPIVSTVVNASTSTKGVVELATSAETITGTDTARAITPAGLQAKVATETAKGVSEIATQAEAEAGADDSRYITPKKMRFGVASSLATNGYIKFPSWMLGVTLQWGSASTSGAGVVAVSFPIVFPSSVFVTLVSDGSAGIPSTGLTSTANRTTSGMDIYATDAAGVAIASATFWFSIGY